MVGQGTVLTTASTNLSLILPEGLEAIGCELGVKHRALDVLMPEVLLQGPLSWPSLASRAQSAGGS